MNKKLFNIGRSLSFLAVLALLLTACEKDDKSNPTFVSANSLELTCQQPNYNGVPYVVQYHVQVALDEDFDVSKELETSYTTAKMNVDAYELNNAMIDLYHEIHGNVDYPKEARPLYIRIRQCLLQHY